MKELVTELIGTFFLVLTIGLAVLGGTPFAPLIIGCGLMVMVYMGGHISGAHYNPAVSVAFLLRGAISVSKMIQYWVAQIAGALLAAVVVYTITGSTFAPTPGADASLMAVVLVEFLFTFALALVILNVAASPKTTGNSYYGAAIGMTVMTGAWAGGAISGGAFNPAVGIGPTILHGALGNGSFAHLWIYIVATTLGAALATVIFGIQHAD